MLSFPTKKRLSATNMNAVQTLCVQRILETDAKVYKSEMETAAVLYGPPGCGKTYVMAQALLKQPVIDKVDCQCCLNLIVCNYAGVSHWKKHLEKASRLITVRCKADISALNISPSDPIPTSIVATDRQVTLLLEVLKGLRFQRIVLDSPEILATGYTRKVVTHVRWFITSQKASIMYSHSFRRRSQLFILPTAARIVTMDAPETHEEPHIILYRETDPHLACITVNMMLHEGETLRARSFLPCYNIRKCDTEYVYSNRARQKLEEYCPICFEDAKNMPRLIVSCCENNFCVKCLTTHLCRSASCPMCRATIHLQDCTSVFETHVSPAGDIIKETKDLFLSILTDQLSRILVVSGPSTIFCPSHLLMKCNVEHMIMIGNFSTLEKRSTDFESGTKKVAIIYHERMKNIPIRLTYVSHVIFLGSTTKEQIMHWTTRAHNPTNAQKPICYSLQSGYDYIFHRLETMTVSGTSQSHGH